MVYFINEQIDEKILLLYSDSEEFKYKVIVCHIIVIKYYN